MILLKPALAIVQPQADAKHITVEKHYEDVQLQCDPDAMKDCDAQSFKQCNQV